MNPIVSQSTEWNWEDSHGAGNVQGIQTRQFQISAVENEVLDCVTWNASSMTAGTEITYVAKPVNLVDSAFPEYTVGDILVASRLYAPMTVTLDSSVSWDAYWQDTNVNGRVPSNCSYTAKLAITTHGFTLSGLPTVFGYAIQEGDIILITNNGTGINGLYKAHSGSWDKLSCPVGSNISIQNGQTSNSHPLQNMIWVGLASDVYQPVNVDTQSVKVVFDSTDANWGTGALLGSKTIDGVSLQEGETCLYNAFDGSNSPTGVYVASTAGAWKFIGQPRGVLATHGTKFKGTAWFNQGEFGAISNWSQGAAGTSGYSAFSGFSGYSGASAYSGYSGIIGFSGTSGASGQSGWSAYSGTSGASAWSGTSGASGIGTSGYSGYSGWSGAGGATGSAGSNGLSGYSGINGTIGSNGLSGYSGISGTSGTSGWSGVSAYSGYSGSNNTNPIQVANACSYNFGATNNITASGSQTVDGQASGATNILLTNQSTASQNGYYLCYTSTSWTKISGVQVVFVQNGAQNASIAFVNTSSNTWTPIYGVLTT